MTECIAINIWERDFNLPVDFDCVENETASKDQRKALEAFLVNRKMLDEAEPVLVQYCRNEVEKDKGNKKKENIFSYVKPESIFIKRENGHPRVALLCRYRYDEEHGLALVFWPEGRITVGSQDIIL